MVESEIELRAWVTWILAYEMSPSSQEPKNIVFISIL